jgi:hypothetical protein
MVRVWLVVERADLAVAGGAVQIDRLGERPVRLESDRTRPFGSSTTLELGEQTAADPQTARGFGDPHAFEVSGLVAVKSQRTAADRLTMQGCNEEQTTWSPELVGTDRQRRVEAGFEPPAKLSEVRAQAELRIVLRRVDLSELDQASDRSRRNSGQAPG